PPARELTGRLRPPCETGRRADRHRRGGRRALRRRAGRVRRGADRARSDTAHGGPPRRGRGRGGAAEGGARGLGREPPRPAAGRPRQRKALDLRLAPGTRLAVAQRALPAGEGRDAFDDARQRLQESLSRLIELARELLGERASATTLERVTTTLRAAALSDE